MEKLASMNVSKAILSGGALKNQNQVLSEKCLRLENEISSMKENLKRNKMKSQEKVKMLKLEKQLFEKLRSQLNQLGTSLQILLLSKTDRKQIGRGSQGSRLSTILARKILLKLQLPK